MDDVGRCTQQGHDYIDYMGDHDYMITWGDSKGMSQGNTSVSLHTGVVTSRSTQCIYDLATVTVFLCFSANYRPGTSEFGTSLGHLIS